MKELSCNEEAEKFKFLRRSVSIQYVQDAGSHPLSTSTIASEITPLSEVPSEKEGNRYAYLKTNILHRYYRDNCEQECAYFGAGRLKTIKR